MALSVKIGIGLKKQTHIHSAYCEEKSCLGLFCKTSNCLILKCDPREERYPVLRALTGVMKSTPLMMGKSLTLSVFWFPCYKIVITTFLFATGCSDVLRF